MAIPSCTQLVLLAFASAALMGVLVKAEICNESAGSCEGIDCSKICVDKHPGGSGTCDQTNTCQCYFDCPPPKKCNTGMGRCSAQCNNQCCAQNCASKYKDGAGYCDKLGATWLCQCKYSLPQKGAKATFLWATIFLIVGYVWLL